MLLLNSSDAIVPGQDLLLIEDERGSGDSLAERHQRLVEGAHHYVAREEPDNAGCLIGWGLLNV